MKNENSTQTDPPVQSLPAPAVEAFIKKPEVARRLGKTVRCVDNWMARGILCHYKIGRSVVFKWSEVEAQLAQSFRVSRS